MKLKRHLSARKIFLGAYLLAFAAYLIAGSQLVGTTSAVISGELIIPKIGLTSDVTELSLSSSGLETPDEIVGSYSQATNKTLLIGHSTTVFVNLNQLKLGDTVNYNHKEYQVTTIDMVPTSNIKMSEVLATAEKDTIVIMTCAGQLLDNNDATHRLVITALNK